VCSDGHRLDDVLGNGFSVITVVTPTAAQHSTLDARGVAVHIASPGSELAEWLRRGHAVAAIVRPDRTVMYAARDPRKIYGLLPTFSYGKRVRSHA
jgi:3-(3-hydroxy-phenyl)propionate hydroxylase